MATTYPGSPVYPGSAVYPGTTGVTVFTPPQRKQTVQVEGALRYSFQVGHTVWRDAAGVWHEREVPYDGDLVGARVLTTGAPVVVDPTTADELTAAGIGTITQE